MNRYQKAKMYKLVSDVDDEFYLGSTCLLLSQRYHCHKQLAKDKPDRPVYKHFNEIGWENVKIILVEEYPCNSKIEMLKKERELYDELKPTLNRKRPYQTKEERLKQMSDYRDKNEEKIAQYKKENREEMLLKKRGYSAVKMICDCGVEIRKGDKSNHCKSKKHKEFIKNNNLE